jgi:hypothetical protein
MMFLNAVAAGRRRYPVITDGLKLYLDAYNLDSYSGSGSTWTDLSNSGYNITITGPTWTESGDRRYFEFDGVNDYMVGSATTSIFDINTSGYTWSFWVNYVTSPAVLDTIMATKFNNVSPAVLKFQYFDNRSSDAGTGTGNGYSMGLNRATPGFVTQTTAAATVPTSSWINLNAVFIYTGARTATQKVYKDGSELVTENFTVSNDWTTINSFLEPVFGAFSLNGTLMRFQNFQLGEVLFYNRPLSGTEITNNYNSSKSNYGL